MRRGIVALALVLAAVAAVIGMRGHRDASTGRVDVVFDTAKGMVPGQLVKIAGARAGHVDAVHLTAEHRARMELRIEDRFLPFAADASCRILPEGPISENYVECTPGVRQERPLASVGGVPTVPVSQTTAPVSIQDLLNVFAAPTESRLRILVNELGIGTAGRGGDINTILRRANPTLRQAQSLLAVVSEHRDALGRAIDQTDTVLEDLGRRRTDVRRFVASAAATARTTADQRVALSQSVARLPALLDATTSGLQAIDRATEAGAPLLTGLERAGPQLTAVTHSLSAFAEAGEPAVRSVAAAAAEGRKAVPPTLDVVRGLKALAATTPVVTTLRDFMTASRDKGAIEYLLRVPYALGTLASLYNGVSHVVTLFVGVQPQCLVAGVTAPGCDQRYSGPRVPLNAPGNAAKTRALLQNLLTRGRDTTGAKVAPKPKKAAEPGPQAPSGPSAAGEAPAIPDAAGQLQRLLGGLGGSREPQPPQKDTASNLLEFLLG